MERRCIVAKGKRESKGYTRLKQDYTMMEMTVWRERFLLLISFKNELLRQIIVIVAFLLRSYLSNPFTF